MSAFLFFLILQLTVGWHSCLWAALPRHLSGVWHAISLPCDRFVFQAFTLNAVLGCVPVVRGYLINSPYNGRRYLSTLWKSTLSGKEPRFLAERNQEDHCPVNKITFMPHLNGMFKGTLCLRASTTQCREQVISECSPRCWQSPPTILWNIVGTQ